MERKTGKYGTVLVPQSSGVLMSNVELELVASKEIMGEIYANRFFAKTGAFFNGEKPLSVRLQGIIGAASIMPASGDDKAASSAFNLFKDAGAKTPVAANAAVAISRAATGKTCWNLIVVNTDTAVVSAVKGTDGDALVESFGAEAGKIPLAQEDEIVLGVVKAPNGAAPVTQADILYRLSDGTALQERSDAPKFDVLHILGGVLLQDELLACHDNGAGVAVPRKVYATYWDMDLIELGHTTKWSLAASNPTTKMPAQNDLVAPATPSGPPEWSGDFERYAVDPALFKLTFNIRFAIVKLYQDRNVEEYFMGAVIVKDWGQSCDQAGAIMDTLSFEGTGVLEWVE